MSKAATAVTLAAAASWTPAWLVRLNEKVQAWPGLQMGIATLKRRLPVSWDQSANPAPDEPAKSCALGPPRALLPVGSRTRVSPEMVIVEPNGSRKFGTSSTTRVLRARTIGEDSEIRAVVKRGYSEPSCIAGPYIVEMIVPLDLATTMIGVILPGDCAFSNWKRREITVPVKACVVTLIFRVHPSHSPIKSVDPEMVLSKFSTLTGPSGVCVRFRP